MTQETQKQNSQTHTETPNPQEENQTAQKVRRPRKTLEQQLAEAEDKRREIKAAMRKQDDRKKIVFGAVVISMLKTLREKNDQNGEAICNLVDSFAHKKELKDYDLIHEVIEKLMAIKPVKSNKKSGDAKSDENNKYNQ